MIEGVAGRFEDTELKLADAVTFAFARGLCINDLAISIRAVKDFGARQFGKDRGTRNEILIAMRLEDVRDLEALGTRTRDYLEWYRITNSKQLSGDFESFIELKENLQSRPQQRKGPVSEYLDGMQRIFEDD